MASPPLLPKPCVAPPPPSSRSPKSCLPRTARASRKPAQSSSSASATTLSTSPCPLASPRDTPVPPPATPCSAPAAPSPSARTAPRPRSNQSPAPPAPAPRPFSLLPPAPRAPQNYPSSNPPACPNQSPTANISATQSVPFCSSCNPLRSKSIPPRYAPRPAQSSPPDEYRRLLLRSSACPKRATHPSTASKSQIPNRPCTLCAKYLRTRPQSCRASHENTSGSRRLRRSPRAALFRKSAPAAPAPPPAPRYLRFLRPAPTRSAETTASSDPPPSSDIHSHRGA